MTNHWIDLKNTDCALIIGSNAAENHPISFKWLTEAKENRGAKIINIDPRFTRTSSKADIYAPMRSGTDIAFVGGMINYIIENDLYFKEYVSNYTNAALIVDDGYDFHDGLFSGYDAKARTYDQSTWVFKTNENGESVRDSSLKDPRCVFQLLKKHYARYDIDTVVNVTGTPREKFEEICKTYGATGRPDKSGTIMYAMGTTQHTVGSQNVRIYAVLQLLLGNIGIPGGGVNALRGESNVQGSTDFGLLFHVLPGYLKTPSASAAEADLKGYLDTHTPKGGYWTNLPKFMVSFLKAMWGPAANPANDFAYGYLPKKDPQKNYSHIALFEAMHRGEIKGAFLWGQNPVVGGPNSEKERNALKNLNWMVAVDLWPTETMSFWSREAGEDPAAVDTEVFVLPACSSYEKEGTISNSGRWMQWRWKATEPVGESKPDLEIVHLLAMGLKRAYAAGSRPEDAPIRELFWDYGNGEHIDIDKVSREINGYDVKTGMQVENFTKLLEDGSTCSGCWIYSGHYPETGNLSKRRNNQDKTGLGQYPEWSWAWPVNRRILYNRCSADLSGRPWSQEKALIWWDDILGKWAGYDVPDFKGTLAPTDPGGASPFIMTDDGVGALFGKKGMKEGPFPEHYEPWESPAENIINPIHLNPVVKVWEPNKQATPDKYPYVATTYRVTEHWQTGVMTRNLPWQCELVPEMFVEISQVLAKQLAINNGDHVIVENTRGSIKVKAMVTERFQPLKVSGKTIHQIGLPWHFGFKGFVKGETANKLTPHIGDGNTMIPEYKSFLVNLRRAD